VATCSLTAGLYWWQRRLDEIAQAELRSRVVRIDQLGTYACRNINSAAEGRRSQHATANAIDIAAFHTADGRVISVLKDYGKETPEGRFLDGAHDSACGLFNIVLGPRYNRLHANQRKIVEPGDVEEALNAASAIGDDRLQEQGQGYVVPDSFTHGTSAQRVRWFKRGMESGDVNACDTLNAKSL
jgi:hypothetical protein